ncbi:MAG: polyprenyl diphosphate synthase [Oscillospiraceae bacterium]|nr:polyprenyl diphosphate synthase [Oscillospiraceae bacterium]
MAKSFEIDKLPRHVGIIMDGNGRWAAHRGLPRSYGHKMGADAFGRCVRHAKLRGIGYLTVYAFSTENWNRPSEEVRGIMDLLRSYLKNADNYKKENVRTRVIGDLSQLDEDLRQMIVRVEENSVANDGINLNIALNYGGRDEIAKAAREAAKRLMAGEIALQQIDAAMITGGLYTAGQPDVDLIIRTGGESRLSNFLLWQSAYAELIFTGTHWPDFNGEHFDRALKEYAARQRRMGGV